MIPFRPLLRTALTSCLLYVALLSAADGAVQATGAGKPAAKVGLPEATQVDDQKLLKARYGKAAPASGGVGLPGSGPATMAADAGAAAMPALAAPDFGKGITGVVVEADDVHGKAAVPVTFGQVFAPGDLKRADTLRGRLADGSTVPLQVDLKATHADGSVRHAVISALLPGAVMGEPQVLALVKDAGVDKRKTAPDGARADPADLLRAGFTASVSATIDGQAWTASADQLLRQKPEVWLDGPLVTEWLVAAPLRNAEGVEHPRLSARFAVRWYRTLGKARVDVTVENTWAYQQAPQNTTYDARILVGGKQVYAKAGLTHLNQARWRKVFWWGDVPAVHLRRDTAYLIDSRALPNYDRSLHVSGAALADLQAAWQGPKTEPMGVGLAMPYMPTTGARNDIGLLPAWAVLYLLSMDRRAELVTMGTADLAGSWSIHYRDRKTGRPISLLDYPYMTVMGHASDTLNPKTGRKEAFPPCASKAVCATPYNHDPSHEPNFAYLPYLLTGDFYDLEELEFWAMYNVFESNPGYRDHAKGLLKSDQVRGQAWSLRTLGEAAYIVPDADPLKKPLRHIVDDNLAWYNATYTDNPNANKLGFIDSGYALVYKGHTGLAPWQDDFFTSAVGHLAELGFGEAARLLAWKAKFPIQRMIAPGACWITGAAYNLIVRDSQAAPFYTTMEQAYKATYPPDITGLPCAGAEMASALHLKPGEMTGYSNGSAGFPSDMQPALAYAAQAGGEAGQRAWAQFMARSVKPDYSAAPQFDIVPRKP